MQLGGLLQSAELSKWARDELNGYSSKDELPDYRVHESEVHGHFFGPFGSGLKNAPIPMMNIEKEHEWLFTNYLTGPVAELERLANEGAPGDALMSQWPADAIAYYQQKFYENMALGSAWRVISKAQIVGILDTVRTRVLEFVIQIEGEIGATDIGKNDEVVSMGLSSEKVSQTVNNIIYGGNVAIGNIGDTTQTSIQVKPGDLVGLKKYLRGIGVTEQLLGELDEALKLDAKSGDQPGPATRSWISRIMILLGTGALAVGTNAAGSLIAGAVMQYLGQHH